MSTPFAVRGKYPAFSVDPKSTNGRAPPVPKQPDVQPAAVRAPPVQPEIPSVPVALKNAARDELAALSTKLLTAQDEIDKELFELVTATGTSDRTQAQLVCNNATSNVRRACLDICKSNLLIDNASSVTVVNQTLDECRQLDLSVQHFVAEANQALANLRDLLADEIETATAAVNTHADTIKTALDKAQALKTQFDATGVLTDALATEINELDKLYPSALENIECLVGVHPQLLPELTQAAKNAARIDSILTNLCNKQSPTNVLTGESADANVLKQRIPSTANLSEAYQQQCKGKPEQMELIIKDLHTFLGRLAINNVVDMQLATPALKLYQQHSAAQPDFVSDVERKIFIVDRAAQLFGFKIDNLHQLSPAQMELGLHIVGVIDDDANTPVSDQLFQSAASHFVKLLRKIELPSPYLPTECEKLVETLRLGAALPSAKKAARAIYTHLTWLPTYTAHTVDAERVAKFDEMLLGFREELLDFQETHLEDTELFEQGKDCERRLTALVNMMPADATMAVSSVDVEAQLAAFLSSFMASNYKFICEVVSTNSESRKRPAPADPEDEPAPKRPKTARKRTHKSGFPKPKPRAVPARQFLEKLKMANLSSPSYEIPLFCDDDGPAWQALIEIATLNQFPAPTTEQRHKIVDMNNCDEVSDQVPFVAGKSVLPDVGQLTFKKHHRTFSYYKAGDRLFVYMVFKTGSICGVFANIAKLELDSITPA